MGRSTYLIAKFVPDLFRNEPINIGVIVWIDGAVASKFIAEDDNGDIDGRHLPKEIKNHTPVYKQWVEAWQKWTARDRLSPLGKSESFLKGDSRFLEALQTTGHGNYVLESGGEILEEVRAENISEVVSHLFGRLVSLPDKEEVQKSAKDFRNELISDASLLMDERVKIDKPVECQVDGKIIHHEFHLYIGNGKPEWLAQFVIMNTAQAKRVRQKAEAIARRFSNVHNSRVVPKERSYVFIVPQDSENKLDEENKRLIEESVIELNSVTNIINLTAERDLALTNVQKWVHSTPQH